MFLAIQPTLNPLHNTTLNPCTLFAPRLSLLPAPDTPRIQIRLAHRFAVGEDPKLSLPATVDLSQLVQPPYTLVAAQELSLTGGASLSSRTQKMSWKTATIAATTAAAVGRIEKDALNTEGVFSGVSSDIGNVFGLEVGGRSSVEGRGEGDTDVGGEGGRETEDWRTTVIGPMEIKTFRLQLVCA